MNGPEELEVLRTEIVRVQGIGKYTIPGYGGLEGQLTEVRDPVTHHRFWVRETVKPPGGWFYVNSNQRWGLKGGADLGRGWVQVLELAVAPEIQDQWDRIAELVRRHDPLGRPVLRNGRFTKKTALYLFENENRDPWERLRR